jgi:glyoxylase-like metal-dependent hydrolase (beta-lactamase superfamily II)
MEIIQIRLKKMATFCYIIGDRKSKKCALIDPAFETDMILKRVKEQNYIVTHLINTHFHADHSTGNSAIVSETGAKLLIHNKDAKSLGKLANRVVIRFFRGKKSPVPDVLLEDEEKIKIGNSSLKVLHTSGHTKGGICLYTKGNVFTGDTLFVGSIGRTDLLGGSHKELLRSIREKIYCLPEDTIVWPGHDYGPEPCSTVKQEKNTNPFTI